MGAIAGAAIGEKDILLSGDAMDVRAAKEIEIDHLARLWYDGWQDAHARILPAELARHRTLRTSGTGFGQPFRA